MGTSLWLRDPVQAPTVRAAQCGHHQLPCPEGLVMCAVIIPTTITTAEIVSVLTLIILIRAVVIIVVILVMVTMKSGRSNHMVWL